MPENKFFLHQIKRTNGSFDKGIVIKETFEGAKQSYHAYLGAYAYGQNAGTDFVSCIITDMLSGIVLLREDWIAEPAEAPAE